MRKLLHNKLKIITIMLMILLSFTSAVTLGNAQMTHLEIAVSTTTLNPDSNNYVTLTVQNDFVPIYELCVSMYFTTSTQGSPTPSILGVHSCTFDKVEVGDSVEIPLTIFAPKDTAGNAYTLNVALTYKRLGYTSSITEDETIGFYVQEDEEWIDMILYEVDVEPDPAKPGDSLSFSANILNKGNIPAMYTNISLVENEILTLQPESYSYLGQIDPNSPVTFDLEASVDLRTREGGYTVEVHISYEDEDNVPYSISRQIPFNIAETEKIREAPQGPLDSILGPFREIFFPSSKRPSQSPSQSAGTNLILSLIPILLLVVVIISVFIFIRRHRSRKKEFEEALEDENEE